MSDALLNRIEIESTQIPTRAAVILLHGLGASGHDFEPIVPYLQLPAELGVRFVFPHAPVQAVTVNAGMTMPAWYDIYDMDIPRREDVEGIRATGQHIEALIAHEIQRGIPSQSIILAGFSQGGAMALYTGLRYPEPLAGMLALSCYLPRSQDLASEAHAANRATPIMMMHGVHDPVIPVDYGLQAHKRLQALGYTSEWHTYPMGHEVHPQQIQVIGTWLAQHLNGANAT